MELYDFQYIEENIIGGVEKNVTNVADILRHIEKKATGKISSNLSQSGASQSNMSDTHSQATSHMGNTATQKSNAFQADDEQVTTKKVTEQKPFNLTKPRPKVIPQPESMPRTTKANPVPKGMFKKKVIDVEKEKEERRKATFEAVRKEYEENPKKRF